MQLFFLCFFLLLFLNVPERFAVVLAQALEDHSPGGSVDPHGKGFSGEEHFDEAPAEEHLDHFFHDW